MYCSAESSKGENAAPAHCFPSKSCRERSEHAMMGRIPHPVSWKPADLTYQANQAGVCGTGRASSQDWSTDSTLPTRSRTPGWKTVDCATGVSSGIGCFPPVFLVTVYLRSTAARDPTSRGGQARQWESNRSPGLTRGSDSAKYPLTGEYSVVQLPDEPALCTITFHSGAERPVCRLEQRDRVPPKPDDRVTSMIFAGWTAEPGEFDPHAVRLRVVAVIRLIKRSYPWRNRAERQRSGPEITQQLRRETLSRLFDTIPLPDLVGKRHEGGERRNMRQYSGCLFPSCVLGGVVRDWHLDMPTKRGRLLVTSLGDMLLSLQGEERFAAERLPAHSGCSQRWNAG